MNETRQRQNSSSHPERFIARQIDRQTCNILRSAEPADGMRSGSFPPNCSWIGSRANDSRSQISFYEPRAHCVYADIFMSVIVSHALRQQDNCTFVRSISCAVRSTNNSKRGSYVNNRTVANFPHMRRRSPGELPNGTNVHNEGVVPLFFGYLLGISNAEEPPRCSTESLARQCGSQSRLLIDLLRLF
jgi:hypothetical protein